MDGLGTLIHQKTVNKRMLYAFFLDFRRRRCFRVGGKTFFFPPCVGGLIHFIKIGCNSINPRTTPLPHQHRFSRAYICCQSHLHVVGGKEQTQNKTITTERERENAIPRIASTRSIVVLVVVAVAVAVAVRVVRKWLVWSPPKKENQPKVTERERKRREHKNRERERERGSVKNVHIMSYDCRYYY